MRLVRSPLARLRQRAGFPSARAAAAQLGVSPAYLASIERGADRPSAELFSRMASLYHANAQALLILFDQTEADLTRRRAALRKEQAP